MPLSEFALIERYFRVCGTQRADVRLAVGDDAALLTVPPGCDLVAATDTLVAGVHFPAAGSPAASIGHRALAANLSDLAAMGARPAWALLALTLPATDEAWLGEFAAGFDALARAHAVALVGGDTTRGPLCVTVALLGHVAGGSALTRGGARAGDVVFVSGTPGDAGAGLALEQGQLAAPPEARAYLRERFLLPTPPSSPQRAVPERSWSTARCRSPSRCWRRSVSRAPASWRSPPATTTSYVSPSTRRTSHGCIASCRRRSGATRALACCALRPGRWWCATVL